MTAKWTAVNGSMHGKTINFCGELKDGEILQVVVGGPVLQYKDSVDIRFTCPRFEQKYLLLGEHAYYMGEELVQKVF